MPRLRPHRIRLLLLSIAGLLASRSTPLAQGVPSWMVEGGQAGALFGVVSSAGDVNGDGFEDVVVGALHYSNGETNEGAAFLYLGSAEGLATAHSWMVEGNQAEALFGYPVSCAGDVNGDGFDDVIAGASRYDTPGNTDDGKVFLYLGSASGPSTVPDWTFECDDDDALLGFWVSSAGNVNGDVHPLSGLPLDDLIVSAPYFSNGLGRVYVFHGTPTVPGAMEDWKADGDQANAIHGISVESAGDVNGDTYDDVIIGAGAYSAPEGNEGRAYVYLGSSTGLALTPAWVEESNVANARFGWNVESAGDVNADGFEDVLVGAVNFENGELNEGAAFLYLGSALGLATTPAWGFESDQIGAGLGHAVVGDGDVNGDGYDDVVVGAFQFEHEQVEEGRAYVFLGGSSGLEPGPIQVLECNDDVAWFGLYLDLLDVDGDGYSEILIGARSYGPGFEGAAFLYSGGPAWGTILREAKISAISGAFTGPLNAGDNFGHTLEALGDLDGDGIEDLAVGALGDDVPGTSRGAVYVLFLDADGSVASEVKIGDSSGNFGGVLDDFDNFGVALAALGDLDGDGNGDLAVGAWEDDDGGTGRGAVWILFLDSNGTVLDEQKISATTGGFGGTLDDGDGFGGALQALGDLDGDGLTELAVGAPEDDDGGTDRGAVWVLFLNADGTVASQQKISSSVGGFGGALVDDDRFGNAIANLGDLDGPGGSARTLAIGAFHDSDAGLEAGAVWLVEISAAGTVVAQTKVREGAGGFAGDLDPGDHFGYSLDGFRLGERDVLAVGSRWDDDGLADAGACWLLDIGAPLLVLDTTKISAVHGGFGGTLASMNLLGSGVAALEDLDGDGRADLTVGATHDNDGAAAAGALWVLNLNDGTLALGASATTWTGATDTQWELAGNWGNGVPDLTKTAIIPDAATTPNDPAVTQVGQECLSLWLQAGAMLGIDTTADHLGVYGGATVSGPITGTGQLRLEAAGTLAGSDTISLTASPAVLAVEDLELQGGPLTVTGDLEGDANVSVAPSSSIDIGGRVDVAADLAIDGSLTVGDGVDVEGTLLSTADGDLTVNGTGTCIIAGQLCFHGDITTSCSLGVQNFTPDPTVFEAANGWPASVSIDALGTVTLLTADLQIAGDLTLVQGTFAVGVDGSMTVTGTNGIVIEDGATLDVTGFQTLVPAPAPLTVQSGGKLNIGSGGELLLESNVLTVESGGILCLDGVEQSRATLSGFQASRYTLTLDPGAILAAKGFLFRQMSAGGIVIGPGVILEAAPYDLRGGVFDLPADNGVLLDIQRSVPTGFRYLVFDDTANAVNPRSIRTTAGATLTFVNWSGDLAPDVTTAEMHDDDPAEPSDRIVFGPPEESDVAFMARWSSDHVKARWQVSALVDSAGFLLQRSPDPAGTYVDLVQTGPSVGEHGHDDSTVQAQVGYRYRLLELLTHGARRQVAEVVLPAASAPDVLLPVWGNTAPPVPPLPLVVGPGGAYPDVASALGALAASQRGGSVELVLTGTRHAAFELDSTLAFDLRLTAESGAVIDAAGAPLWIHDLPRERTLELAGLVVDSGGAPHAALELVDVSAVVWLQDVTLRSGALSPALHIAGSPAVIVQGGSLEGSLCLEKRSRATVSGTTLGALELTGRSLLETRGLDAPSKVEPGSTHLARGPAPTLVREGRTLTLSAPHPGLAWLAAAPRLAFRPLADLSVEGVRHLADPGLVTLAPAFLLDGRASWDLGALPPGTRLYLQGAAREAGTGRVCLSDVHRIER